MEIIEFYLKRRVGRIVTCYCFYHSGGPEILNKLYVVLSLICGFYWETLILNQSSSNLS